MISPARLPHPLHLPLCPPTIHSSDPLSCPAPSVSVRPSPSIRSFLGPLPPSALHPSRPLHVPFCLPLCPVVPSVPLCPMAICPFLYPLLTFPLDLSMLSPLLPVSLFIRPLPQSLLLSLCLSLRPSTCPSPHPPPRCQPWLGCPPPPTPRLLMSRGAFEVAGAGWWSSLRGAEGAAAATALMRPPLRPSRRDLNSWLSPERR